MSEKIEVTFNCKECGSKPAVLALPDNPTDDDIAKCESCGIEFGRYGDVKAQAKKLATDEASRLLLNSVRGQKGWKLK